MYTLSRPYLKDRREPFAGVGPVGMTYVEGRWFDHTSLSDDAYGNRITEPGMLLAYNTVLKKLVPYDHKNGSPDYEAVGINQDHLDVRNGDVALNPANKCFAIAKRCWCLNTGGADTVLDGADLVSAINARIAAGKYNLIGVTWV